MTMDDKNITEINDNIFLDGVLKQAISSITYTNYTRRLVRRLSNCPLNINGHDSRYQYVHPTSIGLLRIHFHSSIHIQRMKRSANERRHGRTDKLRVFSLISRRRCISGMNFYNVTIDPSQICWITYD